MSGKGKIAGQIASGRNRSVFVAGYAEHPGESVTVVAILPHDNAETNDEVVVSFQDRSQLSLYRDQLSVAMPHVGT